MSAENKPPAEVCAGCTNYIEFPDLCRRCHRLGACTGCIFIDDPCHYTCEECSNKSNYEQLDPYVDFVIHSAARLFHFRLGRLGGDDLMDMNRGDFTPLHNIIMGVERFA